MYFKLLTINFNKMEKTSNERLLEVLKTLNIDTNEAANRTGLSYTTMHRIITSANNPNKSTLKSIANGLKLNYDWLLTGKGKMFNEAPKNTIGLTIKNPWEDEAYVNLKSENTGLKKEVERLWQMVSHYTSGATPNFLKAFNFPTTLLNQQLAK